LIAIPAIRSFSPGSESCNAKERGTAVGENSVRSAVGILLAMPPAMSTDRIGSISEYCDRWCERCAFTSRCAAYAVQAALGMCGDLKEALHLAIGVPMAVGAARPAVDLEFVDPTAEE
jgi:hypothetical protein